MTAPRYGACLPGLGKAQQTGAAPLQARRRWLDIYAQRRQRESCNGLALLSDSAQTLPSLFSCPRWAIDRQAGALAASFTSSVCHRSPGPRPCHGLPPCPAQLESRSRHLATSSGSTCWPRRSPCLSFCKMEDWFCAHMAGGRQHCEDGVRGLLAVPSW